LKYAVLLFLLLLLLLSGCAWIPIPRVPAGKEGALIIRCHQVHGWFGRDTSWVSVVWVWSADVTIPENPGNVIIDDKCQWKAQREVIK
jgi:hypothetical protein